MISRQPFTATTAVVLLAWVVSGDVLAEPVLTSHSLRVDVSQGATPGGVTPLQTGFEGFTHNVDNQTPVMRTYTSGLAVGGTIDVTFSGQSHFRDYAAITSGPFVPFSDLLSDNILIAGAGVGIAPSVITLQLDTPVAGQYEFTSYHHSTSTPNAIFDIAVTDANRTSEAVATGLVTSGAGMLTNPSSITTNTFVLAADGINPVEIFFQRTGATVGGNAHLAVNGFEFTLLPPPPLTPEPSTFALFGIVIAAFGGYYYRKRRLGESA